MDKSLNEFGQLRNEMKIGFIELENQLQSNADKFQDGLKKMQKDIHQSNKLTLQAMEKFSGNVERGFLAIEEAMEQDLRGIRSELDEIKSRLDKGNL